jgi:hypothetical protein
LSALRDGKAVVTKKIAAATDPASNKSGYAAESPSKYKATEKNADIDPARVWEQLSAKIPSQKAFLRNSAAAAHVLGIEGRNFQLGFSPDEKPLMEILGTQANRKCLETLLREITGKDWTVKLSVKDELPSKHTTIPESGRGSRSEDFKNDPLIQEALEMFKGEITS